ncbi:MAG: hypothetical protein H0X65_02395 [Gemmatimonadetes bacterium]|nr:hypothetical protein [Gemmatimonadota bacterium]
MFILLFALGTVAALLLPSVIQRYVRQLPDAPLCPGCRALTAERGETELTAVLLPMLAATVICECARCGWSGRMRLRLAPEGARRG